MILETNEHGGRLRTVGSRSNTKIQVGFGNFQLIEKGCRHVVVVMLPGVSNYMPDTRGIFYRTGNRCQFDKLRPCADN
jgi:hypothetical protein